MLTTAPTMIKSIRFKLWLTFLATLVLSTTAMLLFTHASVKQGFLNYVTQQAINRLQYLEFAVNEIYTRELSLDILREDKRLWRRLKYHTFREFIQQQTREALSRNQPPPHPSVKAQERAFIDQIILTDPDKKLIVGNYFRNAEYSWRALYYEENLIGYLGYIKPKDFMRSVDRLFVYQQLKAFALLSAAIVIGSFLVALLVSNWLLKPLSELSRGAKKITAGDFSIRINRQSSDELGLLCQNFNELAKTLAANEDARKQWVADISHEMRTPLAVLKAQIEAMQDGVRQATPQNLELLKNKIDALSALINDLYELSLSDLGAMTYKKVALPLAELVDSVTADFDQNMQTADLEISVDNRLDDKCQILGDSNRLNQLLGNLLKNCLRYTDKPGKVQIQAWADRNSAHITIEDSAPGVPEQELEKIFERLYRLDESRTRATGGAGLGLSICKNIVHAHHGDISASQSDLGGLRINVTLPKI